MSTRLPAVYMACAEISLDGDTDILVYSTEYGSPIRPTNKWAQTLISELANTAFSLILRLSTSSAPTSINRFVTDLLERRVPPAYTSPNRDRVHRNDFVIDPVTYQHSQRQHHQLQGELWVRIYSCGRCNDSEKPVKKPIIVYFHGGGFVQFSADFYAFDNFCSHLCTACPAVVVSVNYRRAPEQKCPAAYIDCVTALHWLQSAHGQSALPLNADAQACFLVGDSAGGNIVHHVGCQFAAESHNASNGNDTQCHEPQMERLNIVGHVLLCPFFGGEGRTGSELRLRNGPVLMLSHTDWFWLAFLPSGANRDHPASNILPTTAATCISETDERHDRLLRRNNLANIAPIQLPPCLVVVAEFDLLKDRQLLYAQGLQRAGKDVRLLLYKGAVHDFQLVRGDSGQFVALQNALLKDVTSFITLHAHQSKDRTN